jgi:hypothetical protein
MASKQEIMDEISEITSIPKFHVSTGSTEPRAFFVALATQLGIIDFMNSTSKPELAKSICQALGSDWTEECESKGSTVTKIGLKKILDALQFLKT